MRKKQNIYKSSEYIYIKDDEKRKAIRKECNMYIYYPRVNNESIYESYGEDLAKMEVADISKVGVKLKSKIELKENDFINFSLRLSEKPSFWCMAIVRRIEKYEDYFIVGCEFLSLTLDQMREIEEYILFIK
ncbi:PilZ domain-containing protein [Clostridium sporogenes]|uniref:PilZ domain-containing protein n=1 Tax=Clostridium sporogenes TaxID=1509 RepID=A0AAE4JSK1_CLOSG|nr:PilZ domain-containing protein [Clostridium sporogenes]MDS1003396.1 PilZ domain-containing protein [Clostridium sporogenes]NFV12470.1 PilZ domain-containing protein [Clostridium sporogenes]